MKERNQLYFITAIIVTLIFLFAILLRGIEWFHIYGDDVAPSVYELLIPCILLWVGWYFRNIGFLLAASIIMSLLIGLHFDSIGILSGDIFLVRMYEVEVKTAFVFTLLLMIPATVIGYYSYFQLTHKDK